MINSDQLKQLEAQFSQKDIHTYQHPLLPGLKLNYVTGKKVIQRLNKVFQGNWSLEILDEKVIDNMVIVKVRITVGNIVKEQYGGKPITYVNKTVEEVEEVVTKKGQKRKKKIQKVTKVPGDLSFDFKAASTDALKRCASLFGVALDDLYGQDESSPDIPDELIEDPKVVQPIQIDSIRKNFKKYRPEEADVDAYLKEKYKIGSIEELSYSDAAKELNNLNKLIKEKNSKKQ